MKYDRKIKEILGRGIRIAQESGNQPDSFFEEYRKKYGFAKVMDSDRSIYLRMYGKEPDGVTLQKIRFWRLGQHLPQNREDAVLLGRALELSDEELDIFLREHCLMQGLTPEKNHVEVFSRLFLEYLCQVTEERLQLLNIPPGMQSQRRRHILYSDALDCIQMDEEAKQLSYQCHMYSRGFSCEFRKYFQQGSLLSRGTVIRLLILFLLPDLNLQVVNRYLTELGYAPLDGKRRQEGYVDFCISQILHLCVSAREGNRAKDQERMKYVLRRYDTMVCEMVTDVRLCRRLRFMKFRSMGNETER